MAVSAGRDLGQAVSYFRALFPRLDTGEFIDVRAIRNKKVVAHQFFAEREKAAALAVRFGAGTHVYAGVNQRHGHVGKKLGVEYVTTLHADVDHKVYPDGRDGAMAAIAALPIAPTILVDSGGGLYPLWKLTTPVPTTTPEEVARVEGLMRRIYDALSLPESRTDPVQDLARILRVPGTLNFKYQPPRPVALLQHDPLNVYAIEEIEALFPATETPRREPLSFAGRHDAPPLEQMRDMLRCIPAIGQYKEDWLTVLMAIHDAYPGQEGVWLAEEWSPGSNGEVAEKFQSFTPGGGVGVGTLFHIAERWGWRRPPDPVVTFHGRKPGDLVVVESEAPAAVDPMESLPQASSASIRSCLDSQEYGDATLFAELYRDRVVYDHQEKAFLYWAGQHWREDDAELMRRLVSGQVAAQYLHELAETKKRLSEQPDDTELASYYKALLDRANKLRNLVRCQHILTYVGSLLPFRGQWDARPNLIAVPNGAVDLTTGCLRNGQPDDFLRTVVPTVWEGLDRPAPRWEAFVSEILEQDDPKSSAALPPFLQRLLGYGVTGHRREHHLPILHGRGRNGKDTLLETIADVLGDVAGPIEADVLIGRAKQTGAASPHLMDLRGRRLVWVSETDEGAKLNLGRVKLITGGGKIKARQLYSELVTFTPTHLAMLVTNERPHASADDYALWQRLLLIPFSRSFVEHPREPSERRKDPALLEKLLEERSGILAWLVRGALAWREHGLQPPPCVLAATEQYRRDEDVIEQFVGDCCVTDDDLTVRATDAYRAYKAWTPKESELTQTAFGKRFSQRYEKRHTARGWVYAGVGLVGDAQQATMTLTGLTKNDGFDGLNGKVTHGDPTRVGKVSQNPSNPSTRQPPIDVPDSGKSPALAPQNCLLEDCDAAIVDSWINPVEPGEYMGKCAAGHIIGWSKDG